MAKYDARLATRVTADVDQRLRFAAVAAGRKSLSAFLTEVLDRALPSAAELAAQLRGPVADDAPEARA
jgi:uncharacterized protein (DUF1778 family)